MLSKFFSLLLISYPLTPKVGMFGFYIYLQEILILLYVIIGVFITKIEARFINIVSLVWVLKIYAFANLILTGDLSHLAYVKQLFMFNILLISTNLLSNSISIRKLFNVWIFVAGVNLAYIVFVTITENPGALSYLFDYSPKYRIIGITGSGFDLFSGELKSSFSGNAIGTNTISLSILLALGAIHSACYKKLNHFRVFFFLLLTILTMSRSGPMVLIVAIAVAYFLKTNSRRLVSRNFRIIEISAIMIIIASITGTLSINKFDFTNIETFITVFVRFEMWEKIFLYASTNPISLLFGIGVYGDTVEKIVGIDYAESLIFDLLLRYGIFGVVVVLLIFLTIFLKIINSTNNSPERLSLLLFLPGLFLANFLAGSSLLTDFLLPIILIMLVKGTYSVAR
ncbi:hypothetical protein OA340_00540 [Paracoccaceae bacterium]|nr:hypothetical protein [Paracoccaceae bacterium]